AELHGGQPYFVMELVPGGSLDRHLHRFVGRPDAAVALLEKVARAVQHAHDQGILHRDLKPGNILLDGEDRPLVGDFGVAKLFAAAEAVGPAQPDLDEGQTGLTTAGTRPGTPAYMAPEQFGGSGAITPRTDVWALGVILYELLTGRRPFPGRSRRAVANAVRAGNPPRPRSLRPEVAPGLEAVVLRCLEPDPARRYPSAAAVADDLARWRRGGAPAARPAPRRQRLRRATALAAVLIVLAGLAGLASAPWLRGGVTPDETKESLYRRAVADHQRELEAGRPADLITPTTRALPYRWRVGVGYVGYPGDPEQ